MLAQVDKGSFLPVQVNSQADSLVEKALMFEESRWQWLTYTRIFEPLVAKFFNCRRTKVAGCVNPDCRFQRIIAYYVCLTQYKDANLYFALKFYIKSGLPVIGLSHHIMLVSKGGAAEHRYYPAIDWDFSSPPPKELLERAVFWWRYRSGTKDIEAWHIVLPYRRRWYHAIYDMKPYTDKMHWALTARRIIKQGIYEDFAILRVWRLDDKLIDYYADLNDPMAWLNLLLRRLFWLREHERL
jgi:hypothetical protein